MIYRIGPPDKGEINVNDIYWGNHQITIDDHGHKNNVDDKQNRCVFHLEETKEMEKGIGQNNNILKEVIIVYKENIFTFSNKYRVGRYIVGNYGNNKRK